MNYKGTITDLRAAGITAREIITQKPKVKHVVYGYQKGEDVFVFDWTPIKFYSEEAFDTYVKMAEAEGVEMIYAVHRKENVLC